MNITIKSKLNQLASYNIVFKLFKKKYVKLRSYYHFYVLKWYGWHSLYWKLISLTRSVPLRKKLSRVVAFFLPKPKNSLFMQKIDKTYNNLNSLQSKGYALLNSIKIKDFKKTSNFLLSSFVVKGQSGNDSIQSKLLLDCIKEYPNENLFNIPLINLVKCNSILELANSPEILSTVSSYLGCKPTLFNIIAWWSIPVNKEPLGAQNFHRDWDDLKFVKCFIYITDVDDDSGPHVYVEKTHHSRLLKKTCRFSDKKVKLMYPENNIIKFMGKAGTIFLEDTSGIHKGLMPTKSKRLVLQFVYTLFPIGAYPLPQHKFVGYNDRKVEKYVSRLYI